MLSINAINTNVPVPQFLSKRFVSSTEDEIAAMKEQRFEKSTVNSTIWGVKIFRNLLREKKLQ